MPNWKGGVQETKKELAVRIGDTTNSVLGNRIYSWYVHNTIICKTMKANLWFGYELGVTTQITLQTKLADELRIGQQLS
jgi:hypothetical protein